MTKSDNAEQSAADAVMSPAINMIRTMQEAGLNAMPGFGAGWVETMSTMSTEMLSFVATRIEKDIQTQQDLLNAKGIAEVQEIQSKFFQAALDDYAAEIGRLAKSASAHPQHATPV